MRAELIGIRNLSGRTWSARLPDGSVQQVEHGRALRVIAGTRFDFGEASGHIHGAEQTA